MTRRAGRTGSRQKWLSCLAFCLLTLLTLGGGAVPGPLAAQESCDAEAHLADAVALMQVNRAPEQVRTALEAARECPDGDRSYDVALFLGFTALRLGDVPLARAQADLAVRLASDDEEKDIARRLSDILASEIFSVSFAPEDGSRELVDVRLKPPTGLPEPNSLQVLVSRDLRRYLEKPWLDLFAASQKVLEARAEPPLVVWLPRGAYETTDGYRFNISENKQISVPATRVKWSAHTASLRMGMLGVFSLNPEALSLVNPRQVGLSLSHGWRLGSRGVVSAEGALYFASGAPGPGGMGAEQLAYLYGTYGSAEGGGPCFEAGCAALSATQRLSWEVGAGVYLPVMLARDVPLLLGVSLRAIQLGSVAVVSADGDQQAWGSWVGVLPTPELRLCWPVMSRGALKGEVTAGLRGGAAFGVPLATGEAEGAWQVSILPVLGGELGGSVRF